MRRRLPLLGAPPAAASLLAMPGSRDSCRERLSLAPGSIGIADTASGVAAADFASELVSALSSFGVGVTIVLLGFEGIPVLPARIAAQLAVSGAQLSAHAVDPASPPLPAAFVLPAQQVQLWVGVPALVSYRPALALLLGADRPLTGWPAMLRALRGRAQLELSQNRAGLAATLASSLNDHGFLPRG